MARSKIEGFMGLVQNAKVFVSAIQFETPRKCEKCNGIGDITQKVADWKAIHSKVRPAAG
jgi:hypothetical protein